MEERADELAAITIREVGKPRTEADAEVRRAVAILRYYSQLLLGPDGTTMPSRGPTSWLIARRRPVGVCALITPWNFPIAIPTWKLAPALAYGNAALLKPARQSTATAAALIDMIASELPDDLLRLLPGGADTATVLIDDDRVAAVSFTGSVATGRAVAERATARGVRVQCEMGGQNPAIVLGDADLDGASKMIAWAAMGYAGQKCTATSRIIAVGDAYPEIRERLTNAVEELVVEDPSDERCAVGPLISPDARTNALAVVHESDGDLLTGGAALESDGHFMQPTLVEIPDLTSTLARDEVFAPVAALIRAASLDEAVHVANGVRHGLVAAIYTRDLSAALRAADSLDAGLIKVNAPTAGVDFQAPFGGSKDSSLGPREQGLAARDFYTESRTVTIEE